MLFKNETNVINFKTLIIIFLILLPLFFVFFISNNQIENTENHSLEPAQETLKVTNEPVDEIELRTANSKTYDNGDGSYKAVVYTKPIHYKNKNGNWIDIYTSDQIGRTRTTHHENIQPDPANGKDSLIASQEGPILDYRDCNFGRDPELVITYDAPLIVPVRSLIYFNLSSLFIPQNAMIINSTFKLYYWDSRDNTDTENGISSQMRISANPLTTNWTEGTGNWSAITQDGVTWNDYDGTNSWATPGGDFDAKNSTVSITPTSYGWTIFNITEITELWLNDSIPNYGLILICYQYHGYVKRFRSSDYSNVTERPKLEIFYFVNDPPEINNNVSVFELYEDDDPKYLVLDGAEDQINGIFKDPNGKDTLSFAIWNGTTWNTSSSGISYNSSNLTVELLINNSIKITPKPNRYGTDEIKIKAIDDDGAWKIHTIIINITSVNDPPVLNTADKWNYSNSNASSTNGIVIKCTQGSFVNLNVTASDVDEEDSLRFNVEDFDLKNTALKELPFQLSESTGNLNFMPSNDAVGDFTVQISVSDDIDTVWQDFIFEIENINDDPIFTEINEVKVIDHIAILGSSSTPAAVQDQKFNITIEANDPDIEIGLSDSLKFATFGLLTDEGKVGDFNQLYSFTPTNSEAVLGFVTTNISVKDSNGSNIDDWVIVNITIKNINDAPEIIKINDAFVGDITDKIIDFGTISMNESVETIIEAEDIDGDTLSCSSNGSSIVENINETTWRINFTPKMKDVGIAIINVTIIDSSTENQLKDWVKLKWKVIDLNKSGPGNGDQNDTENQAPSITITSSQRKYDLEDKIEITGTWLDPDDDEIQIMVKMQFPDGKETQFTGGFIIPLSSKQDYDKNITTYQYLIINTDGTWRFIFDTARYKDVYDKLIEISAEDRIGSELTTGTYSFTFKVVDGPAGAESEEVKIEITMQEKATIKKEKDSSSSILPVIILLIIIIIIVILIVFFMIKRNRKEKALEELGISPQPGIPQQQPAQVSQPQPQLPLQPQTQVQPVIATPTTSPQSTQTVQLKSQQQYAQVSQIRPRAHAVIATPTTSPPLTQPVQSIPSQNIQPVEKMVPLSIQDKQNLLEKQYVLGKINQKTYYELKNKYEQEAKD